jgi:hypothetical protein
MKLKYLAWSIMAAAVLALAPGCATEKSQAELQAEAKISRAQAQQAALARVPGGTVNLWEIGVVKNKIIYTFDITNPRAREITEVQVDALTGEVVAINQEPPDKEAKGKKLEKQ